MPPGQGVAGQVANDIDIVFRLTRIFKGQGITEAGRSVVIARPARLARNAAFQGTVLETPDLSNAQVGQRYIVFLVDQTVQGLANQASDRAAAAPSLPGIARFEMLKVGQTGTAALRVTSGKIQVEAPELQQDYQGKDVQAVVAEISALAGGQAGAGAPVVITPTPAASIGGTLPNPPRGRGSAAAPPPQVTVSGTVVMEGAAPRPTFQLRLAGMGVSQSVLVSDASFSISVPAGQPQQISITDLPPGYVVRSVTDGGIGNLLWTPLRVDTGGALPRIVITLGQSGNR
jgi:hypothetical protein